MDTHPFSESDNVAHVHAPLLGRKDASRYLTEKYGGAVSVAASTLAKLACLGGGPIFHKVGRRVGYTKASLDSFARTRISVPMANTSALTRNPDYSSNSCAKTPAASASSPAGTMDIAPSSPAYMG